MKNTLSLLAFGALLLATPKASPPRAAKAQAADAKAGRIPVVVELFTSEGCSSCPPADALLSKLEEVQPVTGAEIFGLEEHVDYWNHDGWEDVYSSPEWTLRQQEYVARFKGNSPFTPQMIVDGQSAFVGTNSHEAIAAIQEAAHRAKANISITAENSAKSDAGRFEVRVGNVAGLADREAADVWIAVTEDGLQTAVGAGENAGKDVRHAAVVRSLHKIGSMPAKDSSTFVVNQQVKYKSKWKKENLRVVVFVQERKSLHILGAAAARVTG
ncbi:MAG: DUF1223 domain-containing protein [Candidatus Acidiferrales bacterium]